MRLMTIILLLVTCIGSVHGADDFNISKEHPRVLLNQDMLKDIAHRCKGPLARQYSEVKKLADQAVRSGKIKYIDNKWAVPSDLMNCGLTYLIEKELGNPDADKYAQPIIQCWGNGSRLTNKKNCAFGYHALAYDWIYDALSPAQRKTYGNALGAWLNFHTNEPVISLRTGHWEYNKSWGVIDMNVMHSRDAIVQKLFISLAIHGADTDYEKHAQKFLHSWATRIPNECIPAFDAMGGSWAESHGHGAYGPITVIPLAFEAWHTATGKNWFALGQPDTYLKEMSRWLTYLIVPHNGRHAYIDDGGGSMFASFQNSAPVIAKAYNDPLAQSVTEQALKADAYKWGKIWLALFADPQIKAKTPKQIGLPLAYLFRGAGHVFMRSDWDDPNATWAFFGAGPHLAGHQHDDEGHFMISRQGGLVSKGGGKGIGNDSDHYWGGSLVFNILTIYDREETFRRSRNNENDGGLRRLVYNNNKVERGHITAYQHDDAFTYAAADLTKAYKQHKVKEVTRQFLYLRKTDKSDEEYFVIFDRVHSTRSGYAKHFMLHMPLEPEVTGDVTEKVPDHVYAHSGKGLVSSWLSMPQDLGPKIKPLSNGQSRIFLKTLIPEEAVITKRGGDGHKNWGHPLEPSAQYDHHNKGRDKGPVGDWRLEIAAPEQERSYFLHVFQVSDAAVKKMNDTAVVERGKNFEVQIADSWHVTLQKEGRTQIEIQLPDKRKVTVNNTIAVEAQYQAWEQAVKP